MSKYELASQWDNFLLNLGVWQGSFTRISPQGEIESDTPTVVSLEGLDNNRTVKQVVQRFPQNTDEIPAPLVLQYSSLNRSILFFNNGAFSTGAMQFGPFSEFGAEFGFIVGDRRLRLVELFDQNANFASMTLIREYRENTNTPERPPLTLDQLLGEWQGEAVTIYPDWRSPDVSSTRLSLRREGNSLSQSLSAENFSFTSTAEIQGSRLLFNQGSMPMQILLLPDGASCNTPLTIPLRQPFFLEAGWLIDPSHRQRLIRRYDAQGGWDSLTLVTEEKVA
jgi:hypothetical protein